MGALWRIHLLGELRAEGGDRSVTRFRTQKTGALLAYLAYLLHRSHPRDQLIEILWPEDELESARQKLRNALASLRRQLEPPGVPAGAVIVADRADVKLNPAAVSTDVAEFEAAFQAAARAGSSSERALLLGRSVDLYRGELLPGHFEEWIVPERQRLSEGYLQALHGLIQLLELSRDFQRALDYAHRAVSADPWREETHRELMRLLAVAGQPSAALQQYRELERILGEMDETPTEATRRLAQLIEGRAQVPVPAMDSAGVPDPATSETETEAPPPASLPPPPPPVGTVTFLLTDIEGSTALWEKAADAFRVALVSHHELLRREFRRHGGSEIREVGDAFVVAFPGAGHALACAVAAQRALAAHEWPAEVGPLKVRMALHTGDVELEEDGYHDLVLHHASRMLAAGHGGQILCSEVTAGLLRRNGAVPAGGTGPRLIDLGVYRLRDVTTPERLFQVSDPERAQEFPPLRAEPAFASNLPLQFTRFFGRAAEIEQLAGLLGEGVGSRVSGVGEGRFEPDTRHPTPDTRLITLTGPGGSGKTRLALEVARRRVDPLRGAVWFVPLADLADPRLIMDSVHQALRLPRSSDLTPLEQITDTLAAEPVLLVLDNFEHLAAEGASQIRTLLEALPKLTCLVTSRQRLGLEGEREYPVLPLPTPGEAQGREQLTLYESVQLFVDRAQAVRPDFQVTNANAAAVAALCHRLEGIPLALELAAARVRALSPAQMLARLENRLDFLASQRRDLPVRHRTLRAAIEGSYHLLAPELQRFFARLSVFRGGWTLEAAEAVCEEPLALDYLTQLQECSLVLAEHAPQGVRFRMLETLREFAAEQLGEEGRLHLERRHALCYCALAEQAEAEEREGQERKRRGWSRVERDNLRIALEWGLEREPALMLRVASALRASWLQEHYPTGARDAMSRTLQRAVDLPADLREKAFRLAGELAAGEGDYAEARPLLDVSLAISRELGDGRAIAGALGRRSWLAWAQGEYTQARALLEESLAIWQGLGDLGGTAHSLQQLATIIDFEPRQVLGRWSGDRAGLPYYEESLAIYRRIGDRWGEADVLHTLSLSWFDDDPVRARALAQESLAIYRDLGEEKLPNNFLVLGGLGCRRGEYSASRSYFEQALVICRRRGDKRLISEGLFGLAEVAEAQGEPERAARLLGAAKALQDAIGFAYWGDYDRVITALRNALGGPAFAAAWEAGRAMSWQRAAEYALDGYSSP